MRGVLGALAVAAALAGGPRGEGATAAGMTDVWGPLHNLRTADGYPVLALHLARLCDGRTLLMGFDRERPGAVYQSVTGMIVPQTLAQFVAAPNTAITRKAAARCTTHERGPGPISRWA